MNRNHSSLGQKIFYSARTSNPHIASLRSAQARAMSHGEPLVSVVIPAFNPGLFIHDAIKSAMAQTYTQIECIVVDDGSSTSLEHLSREWGPRLRVIRQEHSGVARARNSGVAESRGTLIAFLDADDVWLPFKIEAQVARLQADPSVDFVYGSMFLVDQFLRVISRMPAPNPQEALENSLLLRQPSIFSAQTMLIRKEVVTDVGAWDERLSVSADLDFGCRLLAQHRGDIAPKQPATLYRVHSEQMHHNIEAMKADMTLVIQKHLHDESPLAPLRSKAEARLHITLAVANLRKRRPGRFANELVRAFGSDAPTAATDSLRLLLRGVIGKRFER